MKQLLVFIILVFSINSFALSTQVDSDSVRVATSLRPYGVSSVNVFDDKTGKKVASYTVWSSHAKKFASSLKDAITAKKQISGQIKIKYFTGDKKAGSQVLSREERDDIIKTVETGVDKDEKVEISEVDMLKAKVEKLELQLKVMKLDNDRCNSFVSRIMTNNNNSELDKINTTIEEISDKASPTQAVQD